MDCRWQVRYTSDKYEWVDISEEEYDVFRLSNELDGKVKDIRKIQYNNVLQEYTFTHVPSPSGFFF